MNLGPRLGLKEFRSGPKLAAAAESRDPLDPLLRKSHSVIACPVWMPPVTLGSSCARVDWVPGEIFRAEISVAHTF